MPDKPGLRRRLTARLFGGASGGVFRGMATLALGSGIGRVIGIVSIPVLTRLYSPEDFGVLAVFTAFVAILAPLVTLRYVLALPLPRHDGVAMNLLVVASGLMLILTAIVTLVLWLWRDTLFGVVSMQVLSPWWWLIALGVLGTATYEMLTMWATRKRAYKVIAQTNVTQSAAGAVIKIGMGLAALQPIGLLVGQVVAQAGGTVRLLRGFTGDLRANWRHVSAPRLRIVAWRHRGFPIWRVPSQFLMVFSAQVPVLFVAAMYDSQITGQFGLAMMVLLLPMSIIGQAISKAFYAEIASLNTDRRAIHVVFKNIVSITLGASLVLSFAMFLTSQYLFVWLFGSEWELAGLFVAILSPIVIFSLPAAATANLLNMVGGQFLYFSLNLVRSLFVIFAFGLSFAFNLDAIIAVGVYSLTRVLFSILNLFWFFVISQPSNESKVV